MEVISKEYIRNHKFIYMGTEEVHEVVSGRFAPGTKLPPSDNEKMQMLKIKMNELRLMKTENPAQLEAKTGILSNTFNKIIRLDNKKFSRYMVAEMVVGLAVPFEEANEYFTLQSHPLDPKNTLLDAIVVNCIQTKESIQGFFEMCEENNLTSKV